MKNTRMSIAIALGAALVAAVSLWIFLGSRTL